VWELPFLNDRSKRVVYNPAGGWEITGSTRLSSGVPLTITTQVNTANSFGAGATL
jgi:hypothetical protein